MLCLLFFTHPESWKQARLHSNVSWVLRDTHRRTLITSLSSSISPEKIFHKYTRSHIQYMQAQTLLTHLIKTTAIWYRGENGSKGRRLAKHAFSSVLLFIIFTSIVPPMLLPLVVCSLQFSIFCSRLTFQSFLPLPLALPFTNLPSNPLLLPCTITKGSAS